jgi:hypothetical protein
VSAVGGLVELVALIHPTTDERDVLVDLFSMQPELLTHPDGLILLLDKG